MKLFVPGRVCLFGEHSDWAGQYRRLNADLECGHTVITGTNQGLYAEVKPHPNRLIFRATLADGSVHGPFEAPLDPPKLLEIARTDSFFGYVAGVAYEVLTHYRVQGLEIDNYRSDLPARKGLSSSAAVCVLVARAFNRVYDLKMTVRGEMEFAYRGEITTPSRCGRMDQGCAFGRRPILMNFDGDRLDIEELSVGRDMYLLLVDLHAGKNTRRILADLNRAYPFADEPWQQRVQEYLGPISAQLVARAREAIDAGDAEQVGALMTEAQAQFDAYLQPASPTELASPRLHQLLAHQPLQQHIYGGKGVGSQGDGSAQLVARSLQDREAAIRIIEDDLGMSCLRLNLEAAQRVRKALIPAAGFGTRLFPATKTLKKELFPIIDREGRAKPIILAIIEEALAAGVEKVGVIVQAGDRDIFEQFFHSPCSTQHYQKLSRENQAYCEYLAEVGAKVTFIEQAAQDGFGHAVYCARDWVADEPFLLMLGDHLYRSHRAESCSHQVVEAYARVGHSVIGLMRVPGELVHTVGTVQGHWLEDHSLLSITEFCEKPALDYAREHLQVEGLGEDEYLGVFGQYVLEPGIFAILEDAIGNNLRERGEFQLTSALDRLRREHGFAGLVVDGRRFDIGLPDLYYETLRDYRN